MEYFKEYNRIANWIHRFSLCVRNKNFISSKTRVLLQKYERNFNPVCACVSVYIFLIPASISYLSFHLKILRRLNFVFTDDMHIQTGEKSIFRQRILYLPSFPPNFERKLEQLGQSNFRRRNSKKLFNFSLRS